MLDSSWFKAKGAFSQKDHALAVLRKIVSAHYKHALKVARVTSLDPGICVILFKTWKPFRWEGVAANDYVESIFIVIP